MFIPEPREGRFTDAEGSDLCAQREADGWWVNVQMPPVSLTTICFHAGEPLPTAAPFAYDEKARTLTTPHYETAFDEGGRICRLYDRDNEREVLPSGACANALELYEDRPIREDNWNLDLFYRFKGVTLDADAAPEVRLGALRAVLRFTYWTAHSRIDQEVVFHAVSRRIDFVTQVEWHEDHRVLKAAFPADVRTTHATYDIQYGHVQRPTHYNTSWDFARFEVVGHKWADLSERGYGVSLLNDCKYGYNSVDNVMRLTLLKAGKYPDTEADMGTHSFTYALLPHAGAPEEGDTLEEAVALNLPAHVLPGVVAAMHGPVFACDSRAVAIDAIKKAEDGDDIVVRVHECRGGHAKTMLRPSFGMAACVPCNLLEEPAGEATAGDAIEVELRPFEIKTFRITPAVR